MNKRTTTARAIIVRDDQLLLIERRRQNDGTKWHYFSIPGGHVEADETPEEAVIRELHEELLLKVSLGPLVARQLLPDGTENIYFAVSYLSGQPALRPQSQEAHQRDQSFKPGWVSLRTFDPKNLHEIYQPLWPLIKEIVAGRLPRQPWQIN